MVQPTVKGESSPDGPEGPPPTKEEREAEARLEELTQAEAVDQPDKEPVYEEQMATPSFSPDAGNDTAGGGGGWFTGEEDVGDSFSDPDEFGREDRQRGDDRESGPGFEESINRGFARLAVVGIDEDEHDKEGLRKEFVEVFEEFRLGHYGEQVIIEYLLIDEDIDPIWGFAASATICFILVLYMRPDGEEVAERLVTRLGDAGRRVRG